MKNTNRLHAILAGLGLVLAMGCSTKSPSEPNPTPTNPVPPTPVVTTTVSVSTSASSVSVDSTNPVTVTVRASRSDGQAIPNGTQVTVTTSLGGFGSVGSSQSSVTLDLVNGQATTTLYPGTVVGVANVRATLGTAVGNATVEFRAAAEFFLSSVEPNQGTPNGGTTVTVNGGGFKDPVRVTFDGIPGVVQSTSASRIVVTTPRTSATGAELPKAVTVGVTIRANQTDAKSDQLPNGFIYSSGGSILQPQIVSITPTSGPNDGGTRITINGDGFEAPVQVLFTGPSSGGGGNISLEASVLSTSRTQIVALTPSATGFGGGFTNRDVDITVKNVNSGLQATAAGGFHYGVKSQITSLAPTEGSYKGGQSVLIFGNGFAGPVAISLAGFAQTPVSVTGSEIKLFTSAVGISACQEPSGPAIVTNIDTGDQATSSPVVYTYRVPKPLITSVSPVTGGQAGGTSVTLTGPLPTLTIGFDPPVRVEFGGVPGNVTSQTASQIVVSTPPYNGAFPTEPCNVGTATGTRKVNALVTLTVTNLTTGCTTSLNNSFAYSPTDGSCVVTPPDAPKSSFTFTTSGLSALFNDTSTGSPTSWSWNFGDAATSTAQNPNHTYAAAGTYTVTLTVTNAGGSSTSSQFVTVP